jgi:hypothetical protein
VACCQSIGEREGWFLAQRRARHNGLKNHLLQAVHLKAPSGGENGPIPSENLVKKARFLLRANVSCSSRGGMLLFLLPSILS